MAARIARDTAISETMQSLRRIFKAIQTYSQEISREFGITGPQLWALKILRSDCMVSEIAVSRAIRAAIWLP